MKQLGVILLTALAFALASCGLSLKSNGDDGRESQMKVLRYDRLESRYLTIGDFSALQQMNIDYPMETRMLIEDVLHLGEVSDPEINSKFLKYYQDTTLQSIVADAEAQYANIDDINILFGKAFKNMASMCPSLSRPRIYAQIGALDQSIVVGNNAVGISLDKYLGSDYPLYKRYYNNVQRATMNRENIVPDALCFYLLSVFSLKNHDTSSQYERDMHMGKIMWVVNKAVERNVFKTKFVSAVDAKMKKRKDLSVTELLTGKVSK